MMLIINLIKKVFQRDLFDVLPDMREDMYN